MALLADHPQFAERVVLEEMPGPGSVDWLAEAQAVGDGAQNARRDLEAAVAGTRAAQPRWVDEDCRHAVEDVAACHVADVAAGLLLGPTWSQPALLADGKPPVLLLLAPDAPGVNRLEDATALRGPDRNQAHAALRAQVQVLNTGHCIHRDDAPGWIAAVTSFSARG